MHTHKYMHTPHMNTHTFTHVAHTQDIPWMILAWPRKLHLPLELLTPVALLLQTVCDLITVLPSPRSADRQEQDLVNRWTELGRINTHTRKQSHLQRARPL